MKHLHIIGIGGTFMGSLALLAKAAGWRVTGCDHDIYPPMSTQLESAGIEVIEGFEAAQLDVFSPDMYVIGNVAKRMQAVVEAILERDLPYTSGPQWLFEHILRHCQVLAVAGTHGKTTTSAMLAWILECAGREPGFLIGGVPFNFGLSARLPAPLSRDLAAQHSSVQATKTQALEVQNKPLFVIEADEYDTAFFDKRSKFVHYHPRVLVVNNLEFDHADIFADLAAIQTQFHYLIRTMAPSGVVIANSQKSIDEVLEKGLWSRKIRFNDSNLKVVSLQVAGLNEGEYAGLKNGFAVVENGQTLARVEWGLSGAHNEENALAAILAAREVGVDVETACSALSCFESVKRRMELRGEVQGVRVYDDFAHHPSAIAKTLAAAKSMTTGRVLAVFEPRSNTMKMGVFGERLPASFSAADEVFCYAGGVDWDVRGGFASLENKAHIFDNIDEIVNSVAGSAQAGDVVVVMSNGSFGAIHQKILAAFER